MNRAKCEADEADDAGADAEAMLQIIIDLSLFPELSACCATSLMHIMPGKMLLKLSLL
jgi:hypothetical protein